MNLKQQMGTSDQSTSDWLWIWEPHLSESLENGLLMMYDQDGEKDLGMARKKIFFLGIAG